MTGAITTVNRLVAWLAALLMALTATSAAATDNDLAQRFRPMLKTSLDGVGHQDKYRPIKWQDFVANSNLVLSNGANKPIVAAGGWDANYMDLLTSGSNLRTDSSPNKFELVPGSNLSDAQKAEDSSGEGWANVELGDGVYAHVERVGLPPSNGAPDTRLVNIDYTVLWVWNKGRAGINTHYGDITFLVVLYDPVSDRIVRLSYPAHGCLVQLFELVPQQTISPVTLGGQDYTGANAPYPAVQVDIASANAAEHHESGCVLGPSDKHVFLVPDIAAPSRKFEHPVMFVENGTHETFPNESGFITAGGAHAGDGVSFLPTQVNLLPAFSSPDGVDQPNVSAASIDPNIAFIHFNGLIGTDGASIVLHRTWCWPTVDTTHLPCAHNNAGIADEADGTPKNRFGDRQPYEPIGNLAWPQVVTVSNQPGDTYAVSALQPGDGTQAKPYGGVDVAMTFTPATWTLHLQAGRYPPMVLDRNMTVSAWDGPVVFGAPGP